jgi:Ca2+-binding EF-hand superfamily protein
MPPKKGGKGGKKGKKKKGGDDADAAFDEYLNELFYISPQARELLKAQHKKEVQRAFSIFQSDREGQCGVHELGTIARSLGFNPSLAQLRVIQPMVEDADTGTFVVYAKLEAVFVELMTSKELTYTTTNADGVAEKHTELIYRESESGVLSAFDSVWEATGRKMDQDRVKFVDGEPMRDMLTKQGPYGETFNDDEATEFLNAAADPDTGFVKEDLFAMLSLE